MNSRLFKLAIGIILISVSIVFVCFKTTAVVTNTAPGHSLNKIITDGPNYVPGEVIIKFKEDIAELDRITVVLQ